MSTAFEFQPPKESEVEQEIRDSERWRIWRLVLTKMESETNIQKFLALDEICQAIRNARWQGGAQ